MSVGQRKSAYVASHFAIEVEKKVVGFCRTAEGGGIKADVLSYQTSGFPGGVTDTWRYGGKPKFDDITVQIGMGMSKAFYEWISGFFKRSEVRKSGAILAADFGYLEKARRTFTEALISEIQMPGVDGSDKNPCYMTVKIAPETLVYEPGTNKKLECDPGLKQPQKKWLAANFKLQLETLDEGLQRVMKVDGFTIKQQILDYHYGRVGTRFPLKVAGRLEYPNLTFYVPEVDAKPFVDLVKQRWNAHVPKKPQGLTGALTYQASDGSDLCTVALFGVDVTSVEPEKFEASSENLHRVKVGIHVEKMEFTPHPNAFA